MSRPMVPIVTALILGIVSANSSGGGVPLPMLVAGVSAVAAGVLTFLMSPKGTRRTAFLTVWLMLPGITWLGYARTAEADVQTPLKAYLERSSNAAVTGTIDYISLRQDGYAITVAASLARIGQLSYKADKIIISADYSAGDDYHIGDVVTAVGKLYPCEKPVNPGQFNSELYYRLRGVDARMYADSVNPVTRGKGLRYLVNDAMFSVRKRLSQGIYEVLPATEAGTLNAMLTGDRGMLDEDVRELYSEGGIAHILSISSLHITLLGMGLFRLLMKLFQRLRLSVAVTLGVMLLYGILTGFPVSTCRALLMLTVSLVGKLLWRGYDLLSSVALAAFLLLVKQPCYLYDSGFELSFLAVLGICASMRLAEALELKNDIGKSLMMSVSIQVFTMPVIMNSYFCVRPYGVIVNILILPLMSILLVAGFMAGGIGCTPLTVLGRIIAGPVYYILKLYEKICELEAELPYSTVITGAPDKNMTAICYVLIYAGFAGCTEGLRRRKKKENKKPLLFMLLTVMAAGILFLHPGRPELYCAFLDVGQGDSIYIEAGETAMLVDSGSTSVKSVGKYRVVPFLKHRGVTCLDRVVISHPDTDHVSAVLEMLEEGYPAIGELIVGENVADTDRVIAAAEKAGIPVRKVVAGEKLSGEETGQELECNVISPDSGHSYEDVNSGSVVLELLYDDFSLLLTGDSDFKAEELYCDRLSRASFSVLKCAHHGSKYSTSLDMLARVRPVVTVISCSKYNTYGHPNPFLMDRLEIMDSEIFTTPECGMVSIEYDSDRRIRLRRYLKSSE